ncbi:MAG TPA: hypothetical protein VF199_04340, partial [Bacillales bacterium]
IVIKPKMILHALFKIDLSLLLIKNNETLTQLILINSKRSIVDSKFQSVFQLSSSGLIENKLL